MTSIIVQPPPSPKSSMFGPLLTDRYQLIMLQAYFDSRMDPRASFEAGTARLKPEFLRMLGDLRAATGGPIRV